MKSILIICQKKYYFFSIVMDLKKVIITTLSINTKLCLRLLTEKFLVLGLILCLLLLPLKPPISCIMDMISALCIISCFQHIITINSLFYFSILQVTGTRDKPCSYFLQDISVGFQPLATGIPQDVENIEQEISL